jgi:hypothetical protein
VVVDGSELREGLEGARRGGRLGLEPRDSRRDRPLAEDRTDAASDLSGALTRVDNEAEGLSLFVVEAEILLRSDPRMDREEPCVSDLEIGKVLPSTVSEVAEELAKVPPFSPDLFEGC